MNAQVHLVEICRAEPSDSAALQKQLC